jgi:hypothetical protein
MDVGGGGHVARVRASVHVVFLDLSDDDRHCPSPSKVKFVEK